eukprot:1137779-Pelagomonas_calceolata.AAC.1
MAVPTWLAPFIATGISVAGTLASTPKIALAFPVCLSGVGRLLALCDCQLWAAFASPAGPRVVCHHHHKSCTGIGLVLASMQRCAPHHAGPGCGHCPCHHPHGFILPASVWRCASPSRGA